MLGDTLAYRNGRFRLSSCADVGATGPIQCSPGATAYWKSCEGFPKVLDDEGQGLEVA